MRLLYLHQNKLNGCVILIKEMARALGLPVVQRRSIESIAVIFPSYHRQNVSVKLIQTISHG